MDLFRLFKKVGNPKKEDENKENCEENNVITYKRSGGDIWTIQVIDFDYYRVTNLGVTTCKGEPKSDGYKKLEKLGLTACYVMVENEDGTKFMKTSLPVFIDSIYDDMGRDRTKEVLQDASKGRSEFLSFPDLKALFKDTNFKAGDCNKQYLGHVGHEKSGAVRDKSYAKDFFEELEKKRKLLEKITSNVTENGKIDSYAVPPETIDFYNQTCQPKELLPFDKGGRD